ncbi:helix-turn-helix transcriptional regulator [uncultured Erythrobacter sp.]|uniref:helix-turn-helix transcriptional regulator n=1 Tax=uncultured Erythrobacter sp. TaxID=263913 RepID=UPI00345D0E35
MEQQDALLTIKEVMALTGIKSRTSIYSLMETDGRFPRPLKFGTRGLRFRNSELQTYIRRLPYRDGGGNLL